MNSNLGTSNISELPYNNIPLNSVEDNGNKIIENKIQNEINNRNQQTQLINNDKTIENVQHQLQSNDKESNIDYNRIVNDIQKASQAGATSLPSRDIPMDTQIITQDEQTKPNFIPQSNVDYIGDSVIVDNTINQDSNLNNLESFYNTLQIPILLSILYFLFQLPVFKKYILLLIPSLFNKDGNQNIYGYIFYSILYGVSYIILSYIINKLNNM